MSVFLKMWPLCLVVSSFSALAFERINEGDTVYVACKSLIVYEKPTAFSTMVRSYKFGDKLNVKGLKQLFPLPATDFSSKEFLEKREKEDAAREERRPQSIPEEKYMRAAWLQLKDGYGAASCLVQQDLFSSQTEEEVLKRVEALASGKAKRNFSEDESGDMTAMRGAAGKAKGGKADYETIDKLANVVKGTFNLDAHNQFRQQGSLGEYQ